MKVIGITGPTGAGKTTALGVLAELGAEIIDCDAVYHALLEKSAPLRAALTCRFGPHILDNGGKIDRKRLGAVVFQDEDALRELNTITHRFVLEELNRRIAAAERKGRRAAAIDAIALLESGAGERCHAVVAVLAPKEVRVRRIMEREQISEEYARSRVEAQKSDAFFREHCSYVLENGEGETRDDFCRRARALFEKILSEQWNCS